MECNQEKVCEENAFKTESIEEKEPEILVHKRICSGTFPDEDYEYEPGLQSHGQLGVDATSVDPFFYTYRSTDFS